MDNYLMFFFVSLVASIAGAISGIGGGVIIRPLLEFMSDYSIESISFLSGCTVLSMSSISLMRRRKQNKEFDYRRGTMLAIGSAIGGIAGKVVFNAFHDDHLGVLQSALLFFMILSLLVYLKIKKLLKPRDIKNSLSCLSLGLALGMSSAFLGIGGGPINLAVLTYFLSIDNKTASLQSLYIILFSQTTSLMFTIVNNNIPLFPVSLLLYVIVAGIIGGIIGSHISCHMTDHAVGKLYGFVLLFVLAITGINLISYV